MAIRYVNPTGPAAAKRATSQASAGYLSPMTPNIEASLRALTAAQSGWINPTPDFSPSGGGSPYPTATRAASGGGGAAPAASPWSTGNPYASILAKYMAGIPTPGSLLGTARKSVSAELAPVLAQLTQNSALQQRQMQNQATRAGNFAKALAAINLQQGGDLAQDYRNTAGFLGQLGTGLTGAVAQDWNAQTQAAQAAVNQMTGGLAGQTVSGYDPAAMRNTEMMTGVTLPAADLAQQGLNAERGLVSQGMADVLGVGNIAQQYDAKVGDLQAQLAADKAKEISQKPELIQKALDSLRNSRESAIANVAKLTGGASDWETTQAKLGQNQQTLDIQQQGMDIKGKSADAYNRWLDSRATISAKDLAWKKAYQTQQLTAKQKSDAAKLTAEWARIQNQSSETARKSSQDAWNRKVDAAGLWFNPLTKSLEKKPAGTYIGKDGMPHDATPSTASGSKGKPPKASDVRQFQTQMQKGVTQQFGIAAGPFATPASLAKLQGQWSRQRVVDYLWKSFGNAFLVSYPGRKTAVNKMINDYADTVASKYGLKSAAAAK